MKYQICLISILSCLLFVSCNKRNVIWSNYTDDKKAIKVTIEFGRDDFHPFKKVKMISNKTKQIYIANGFYVKSVENSNDYNVYIPLEYFDKNTKDFELIITDKCDVIENKKNFVFPVKKNVVAYYIDRYDKTSKMNYRIISKDNIIDKVKILPNDDTKKMNDILPIIESSDYAYYLPPVLQDQTLIIDENGYIVKSKINNSFVFISAY